MLKNTQFYMTDIKIHRRNFPTVNLVICTVFATFVGKYLLFACQIKFNILSP